MEEPMYKEPLVVVLAGLDGRQRFMTDDPVVVEVVRSLMKSSLDPIEPTPRSALGAVA